MTMNLEHIHAVKARIEDIRRRFVSSQEPCFIAPSNPVSFDDVLQRAQTGKGVSCPEELEQVIRDAGARHGVDPAVIKAVIKVESGFRNDAISRTGARGLMQLMPGTARALGVDPDDPAQNIDGGTRYLRQQMDRFGRLEHALAAYNAGPGSVAQHGGIPPYPETSRYVADVMRNIPLYSAGR